MQPKSLNLFLLALCAACGPAAMAQQATVQAGGATTQITFFSPEIVRVQKIPDGGQGNSRPSLVVTMKPADNLIIDRKENGKTVALSSERLTVNIDKRTGRVSFVAKGRQLLGEKAFGFEPRTTGPDRGSYRTTITYQLQKDEPIYGLGTLQDGKLNRRGTKKRMEQSNLEDFQYVLQSQRGWGIYWDNYSRADFDDSAQGMSFSAEVGDDIDYYFMLGGSVDGVNRRMRQLSGKATMLPLWTYGYWQSKERYKTEKELKAVVDWHRQNHVPLDGIIQDWQYWGSNYTWNAMDFISDDFSHAKRTIEDIHRQNAHVMISIWASFGPMTQQYKELEAKGLLYDFETWPQSGLTPWPPRMDYPSGVKVYDALSKDARDIYWRHLSRLHDYGIDAWWMDSTDPDFFNAKDEHYDHSAGDGTWRRYRNVFPLVTVGGVSDGQLQKDSTQRVFIMTRSAFAGMQRYGGGLWTGDVASTWDMLRKQVPAGLNFSMTANPNFNTDIGGFFCSAYNTSGRGSAPRNPQYQELYVRWMQYGLTCPVFRSHGADAPREIYQFGKPGEPVYDAILSAIQLRYRLLPYLYSTAWQVSANGESYLRPLVSDFPNDRRTWDMATELMFGRSFLAAPVLHPQYTEERVLKIDETQGWYQQTTDDSATASARPDFTQPRQETCYLPRGCGWYDFYTGKHYQGGRDITFETHFDRLPLFLREGSIVPLAPVTEWATQQQWDNLELIVAPGQDGAFTLYEDEGDGYNFEKGQYSTIDFHWNNRTRTLTIADRKGEYAGMLRQRKFSVHLIGSSDVKEISYDGQTQQVKL